MKYDVSVGYEPGELRRACGSGDILKVVELLDTVTADAKVEGWLGLTPLYFASEFGHQVMLVLAERLLALADRLLAPAQRLLVPAQRLLLTSQRVRPPGRREPAPAARRGAAGGEHAGAALAAHQLRDARLDRGGRDDPGARGQRRYIRGSAYGSLL